MFCFLSCVLAGNSFRSLEEDAATKDGTDKDGADGDGVGGGGSGGGSNNKDNENGSTVVENTKESPVTTNAETPTKSSKLSIFGSKDKKDKSNSDKDKMPLGLGGAKQKGGGGASSSGEGFDGKCCYIFCLLYKVQDRFIPIISSIYLCSRCIQYNAYRCWLTMKIQCVHCMHKGGWV